MRPLDARLLRRARAARTLLAVDVVLGVGTALLVLAGATLLAHAVTRAFAGESLRAIAPTLVLLAVVFALRGACAWGFEIAGGRAAAGVLSDLRLALVERRLRSHPAALDGADGAEIAAAAVQGVDGLAAYFGRYLPQLVLACIVPPAVLLWVAVIDVESALLMLATVPLVPVFMWLIGRYTEERSRTRWRELQRLSTHFLDVVRGLPTLRAFNRSRPQTAAIAEVSDRYRRATMATLRVSFLSGSVLELAATLGVALVAVTVGVRLVDGGIGLTAGLTVLIVAPELYVPLRQLGAQFHASADGLAAAERIVALLEAPASVAAGGSLIAPSPAAVAVRLDGVAFSYPARPGRVLDGLDLELRPGETVALVGPSGAGKSTVASLILRLAEPTAGCVTAGGTDLAGCDPAAWRAATAWVPQRPTMFRATVADNIRLGAPGACVERVHAAAGQAGAEGFVRALPDGYDTLIGDGGRPLSAGERRRIALARAFLRDAPLVILDEPTADLDEASTAIVADAVERLRRGRTVLVIAHDAAVVGSADRVVVLEQGRAIELPRSAVA
ncbi:MAG TPA: thiol reductant ABC exporter subunit CydD [Gaiellales bacterium]|jgi:thiol reductant ABC exporter CydD subunit|nr:thiol reductant ABC exporter subunit CydD [Gaiellales bacterium]